MKIVLTTDVNEDYEESQDMTIDDVEVWHGHDLSIDAPEDATLGRGMTSGGEIIDLMRLAHEAGEAGEKFIVELINNQ